MSKKGFFSWLGGKKMRSCCNIRIEEMTGEKENQNHNGSQSKADDSVKSDDKMKP